MKRSLNQIGANKDEGSPPRLKRAATEGSYGEDEPSDPSFLLAHQNRELGMELRRRRRKVAEIQKQSEFYQAQLSDIQDNIGFINRIWTQFENDILALLRTLNKRETAHNQIEWKNMLKVFLDAGKTFYETVPTSVANCLDIDEWSSDKDITLAKEMACDDFSLSDATKAIGEELEKKLVVAKSIVGTLCEAVNSASGGNLGIILQTYSEERAAQAEKLLLIDQLTTCQKEVLTLKAELSLTQHTLYRAERALQIATEKNQRAAASSAVAALSTPFLSTPGTNGSLALPSSGPCLHRVTSVSSVVSVHSVLGSLSPITENTEAALGMNGDGANGLLEGVSDDVGVLQEKYDAVVKKTEDDSHLMTVLQSQIDDAEVRRMRAEQSLLEYMSRAEEEEGGPDKAKSKEATEVERVTKKLQETRTVCNKHLAEVQVEKTSLMTRVTELQAAMDEVMRKTQERLEEMTVATEEQIQQANEEKTKLQEIVKNVQADLKQMEVVQRQLTETQELFNSTQTRCKQQDGRIKSLQDSLQMAESHLSSSRAREAELEAAVKDAVDNVARTAQDMAREREQAEDEEGIVLEEPSMLERIHTEARAKLEKVLMQSQQRCEEMESELRNAKLNMEDLVLEIEAVATEEERTREQNVRLLQQIAESQSQQKSLIQENFRLHQINSDLKEKELELQQRVDAAATHVRMVESVLTTLRSSEQSARSELHQLTVQAMEKKAAIDSHDAIVEDLNEKLRESEVALATCKKKMGDLKNKCGSLSHQYESERRKRMEIERVRAAARNESLLSSGTDEENTMLDITLNMLRCSVCKDRFKEVAITRCFHLFCKECIDENLRNRSRKCPACGEKFGQDDVKQVYFTS